jgi:hypothetical protein
MGSEVNKPSGTTLPIIDIESKKRKEKKGKDLSTPS